MSNIHNTLQNFDQSDPEKLKISKIEADKHSQPIIIFKNLKLKSEVITQIYTYIVLYEKATQLRKNPSKESILLEKSLLHILENLKKLFSVLSVEDRSQNVKFADSLSRCWNDLYKKLQETERGKKLPHYYESLKWFTQEIEEHPKGNDHTLGYYLSQYAGEKWIPFPFMDILKYLHEEALVNKTSTLKDWIRSLSLLIESLIEE